MNSRVLSPFYVLSESAHYIEFLDNFRTMPNEGARDVSEAGDGSVMAWTSDRVEYIAAEGGVIAPVNCGGLFSFVSDGREGDLLGISFNNCFDTSNVTDMSCMFYCNLNLRKLDLSSFDTSNVTDMSYMFGDCYSLEDLDLSSFYTGGVTSMVHMFWRCESLTSLKLNINISSATDITYISDVFEESHY